MNDDAGEDDYVVEKCSRWMNTNNLSKVCLQFPDRLLPNSVRVALRLGSRVDGRVYVLGDTSCGSCCVDEISAQHVDADGIIHFGHACLSPTARLPSFHVLPRREVDSTNVVQRFESIFTNRSERILFFYDVAYAYEIERMYERLRPIYENLTLTRLDCTSDVEFTDRKGDSSAAILGRCFELDADCEIGDYAAFFLGDDGKTFRGLAMAIPARRWYCLRDNDVVECEALNAPWLKRRRYVVERLKDAKVVGIVVSTLGIRDYLRIVTMMKDIMKRKKKKSYILSVGKINPTKLANFPEIDAFVVITCPENEIFDSRDYLRPLLLPYEVELAFNGSRERCAEYCMDFRPILPGGMNHVPFEPSTDSDVSLITGELRDCDESTVCTDEMNALVLDPSSGVVAIGRAGAEFLQTRSWKGVEQRLGKDVVRSAEIGRCGLPSRYENEPVSIEKSTNITT